MNCLVCGNTGWVHVSSFSIFESLENCDCNPNATLPDEFMKGGGKDDERRTCNPFDCDFDFSQEL